jgi:hypothetical protein
MKYAITNLARAVLALAECDPLESAIRYDFISDAARAVLLHSESDSPEDAIKELSISHLARAICVLAVRVEEPEFLKAMAAVLGIYMMKLDREYAFPPIYPNELLPLPKSVLKDWGFRWAELVVKGTGKLLKFQQKAVLYYTSFQQLSPEQWENIKTRAISDLVSYNRDMRERGTSGASIPPEYKALIDAYRREFDAEASELLQHLRSSPATRSGCAPPAALLLGVLGAVALWLTAF